MKLPEETRNYIPIIVALTFIGKNAEKYGLENAVQEDPWVYDTVAVTHPVDLRLAAEIVGTTVGTIRDLNPSLLRMTTPNVPGYALRIPLATKEVFQKKIAMVPPEKRVWWRWHNVRYGETLSGIAQKYRTSLKAIAEVNNLDPEESLQDAAELVIPVTRTGDREIRYQVRAKDTLSSIARRYNVSPDQIMSWNNLGRPVLKKGMTLLIPPPEDRSPLDPPSARNGSASPAPLQVGDRVIIQKAGSPAASLVHRVRKGESLWQIASSYNISLEALKRSNTQLGETLRIGDRVIIPSAK